MQGPENANPNSDFSLCHHFLLGCGCVAGPTVVAAENIARTRKRVTNGEFLRASKPPLRHAETNEHCPGPLHLNEQMLVRAPRGSHECRYCCKSPKLPGA